MYNKCPMTDILPLIVFPTPTFEYTDFIDFLDSRQSFLSTMSRTHLSNNPRVPYYIYLVVKNEDQVSPIWQACRLSRIKYFFYSLKAPYMCIFRERKYIVIHQIKEAWLLNDIDKPFAEITRKQIADMISAVAK